MIGSPLSFNQPFLASRTSMYGKHPPSSQIRAAHIDWDSLSMMEELGWNAPSSSRADWQGWRGPGAPGFAANGGGGGHGKAAKSGNPFMQQPQAAFTQHPQQQYLQYLQHMHSIRPNGAQQPIPAPGGHLFGDALGMDSMAEHVARPTPLSLLGERGQQLAWEYARQFHPILVSFSAASPHKLSVSWRWTLLFFLALSMLCVVVGVPVVLTILLRQEETFYIRH
ncbi:hypothetical protein FBU59_000595 [Linderina macrospora]|uniref:Uncharacterized protein n=1 Tax=Linderina macrospora TaxID=4868 RepID=A0ACC1JGD3_9FUNG|nr:hypothetical protein FBU59_000595 [Linderina macrospora]